MGRGATSAITRGGLRRRQELLAAALRIIVREGPEAVTHRSVAAEAGASHGSVVYYFGSREELLRQALEMIAASNIEWLESLQDELIAHAHDPAELAARFAHFVAQQMVIDRDMGIAVLELHLAAARYPELRPHIRHWGRAYARAGRAAFEKLGSAEPARDARLVAQLINGMVLEQLAVPRRDFERRVLRPTLERILRVISGP